MAVSLEDKVVLITGGTSGIGRAAATELARRGATLVLVGRDREKSERVVRELRSATGNDRIELVGADLSEMEDVRRVAAEFRARHRRLDLLVTNAGAMFGDYRLSADGVEMTFAVNHVAHFLLTQLLLDLLKSTPGARVVSTSGIVHRMGKLDLSSVVKRDGRAGFAAYCDAKLATILFTRELARRVGADGVIASCFHPGWVRTGFGKDAGGLMVLARLLAPIFARTPERGADTLVWLATSTEAAKHNGEYFSDRGVARTSELARDRALAEGLWRLTEELCAASNEGGRAVTTRRTE
jgi:NAD(P)-dependent dehydrogenase (short-subunit alcohol dehydrogenase family)